MHLYWINILITILPSRYKIIGVNVNLLKVDCCRPVHTKCNKDTED